MGCATFDVINQRATCWVAVVGNPVVAVVVAIVDVIGPTTTSCSQWHNYMWRSRQCMARDDVAVAQQPDVVWRARLAETSHAGKYYRLHR